MYLFFHLTGVRVVGGLWKDVEFRNTSEESMLREIVPQAYHPLFVWLTVLFNGRYGYEF